MHSLNALRFFSLPLILCLAFVSPQLFAASELNSTSSTSSASSSPATGAPEGGGGGGGGHGKAKSGTMLGGILIAVGTIGLGISTVMCYNSASLCWKIPLDLLAIAGGIMAMNQNSKSADETAPKGINLGGITAGGLNSGIPNIPDGVPNVNIAEKCREAPSTCTCNDTACSQPQLTLPPKEELEKLIRSGTMPDGTSLEDALAKLNENYDKARDGVGKFNQLSTAGAFDPAGGGLASTGDDSGDSSENGNTDAAGVGLGSASGKRSGGDDLDEDDFKTEPMIDALAKQRGEQGKVLLMGMNAINKNGKALTIFERLTRALRGKNNRDLILAKNEWIRKKALKNKKNSVKLNLNALQKK